MCKIRWPVVRTHGDLTLLPLILDRLINRSLHAAITCTQGNYITILYVPLVTGRLHPGIPPVSNFQESLPLQIFLPFLLHAYLNHDSWFSRHAQENRPSSQNHKKQENKVSRMGFKPRSPYTDAWRNKAHLSLCYVDGMNSFDPLLPQY